MSAAASIGANSPRGSLLPAVLREYLRDATAAFRQAPLEVALGLFTAVTFSIAMRQHADATWSRVLASTALALPLLFGLSVLRARGVVGDAVRWGASLLVLLAVGSYAAWVFDSNRQAEGLRLAALIGAAVMALSLVPVLGVAESARRTAFWRFNARLLTRVIGVVAYAGALFAALAGAVAAVTSLFDLNTPEQLYGDLAGAVFFALVPWVVVGGISELIGEPDAEASPSPRLVRLVGRYLYAPVLGVYLTILLAYAGKVLVTGEAPKNLLSPIILLAGAFGFLGSALLEPLRRDPEHEGVARLMRLLPLPLLALLPFGLWAVWVRRDQYGWTESRYLRFALLVALAVLAVIGVVRLVRRREPVLLLVPVVLGVTLLLSATGPWGAVAVSRRSQQERLVEGLEKAGLLSEGRVTRPLTLPGVPVRDTLLLPAETYDRIAGSLRYLYDEHGPAAVQPLFGAELFGYPSGSALALGLGLRATCPTERTLRYASGTLPQNAPLPGLPAGTLYRLHSSRESAANDTSAVRLRFDDAAAVVTLREGASEWTARADLRPVFAQLTRNRGEGCSVQGETANVRLTADDARRPLLDASGAVTGVLLLTDVEAGVPGNTSERAPGRLRLERLDALVVIERR
jgi:hypothetical protein